MSVDREAVLAALRRVVDPDTGRNLVESGAAQGLAIRGDQVSLALEVDPRRGAALEPLRRAAEAAVRAIPGVGSAQVVLTAHSATPAPPAAPPDLGAPRAAGAPLRPVAPPPNDGRIAGVRHVLAVGSGKGGVGKSTVSANLAVAMAQEGARVGLLDADVYGPSQPRMMGASGRPGSPDGRIIEPLRAHGVALMSMGFLTDEDQSVVWRGPMLMSALTQMLHQVAWGELDALIVDLPPGTGDVQLTLSQKARVSGAVVVSTPQDVALLDARKAIDMFRKLNVPILGMIENMSTFCCPSCGSETQIFGHGGARREAARLGLPFLGEVPLDVDIRLLSDEGAPITVAKPRSPQSARFRDIARALLAAPELAAV
jgi:ATP-binding protein involved in chromosome partitioning